MRVLLTAIIELVLWMPHGRLLWDSTFCFPCRLRKASAKTPLHTHHRHTPFQPDPILCPLLWTVGQSAQLLWKVPSDFTPSDQVSATSCPVWCKQVGWGVKGNVLASGTSRPHTTPRSPCDRSLFKDWLDKASFAWNVTVVYLISRKLYLKHEIKSIRAH